MLGYIHQIKKNVKLKVILLCVGEGEGQQILYILLVVTKFSATILEKSLA